MSIDSEVLEIFLRSLPRKSGISLAVFITPFLPNYKKQTINNSLSRLKKKQLLMFEGNRVVVSEKGKQYLKRRQVLLKTFASPFLKGARKNLIVMFDIPEERKSEREWLRSQLKQFGYEMIQKSVWFGPSPLPKEFIGYVERIGLRDTVKMFKISKGVF